MRTLAFAAAALFLSAMPALAQTCPPEGYDRARLEALAQAEFEIPAHDERNAFALAIAPCLADPDPFLRDRIAFTALAAFLRGQQLSETTQHRLVTYAWAMLRQGDEAGYARPFAALALSELARADRIQPFMAERDLNNLASDAAEYVTNIRDYRGFDETEGWRHGIAHGADLLLQLALNPRLEDPWFGALLDAVASQVVAHNGHFYTYGESERLARVVLFAATRGLRDEAWWAAWFQNVAGPAPLADWSDAFTSQAGLAKRHNTMAFLLAVYANARIGGEGFAVLLPGVEAALRQMP